MSNQKESGSGSPKKREARPREIVLETPGYRTVLHADRGRAEEVFLTGDIALQKYVIGIVRRYILDPLDLLHTPNNVFIEQARQSGVLSSSGQFDYRLRSFSVLGQDGDVSLDDVLHIVGMELYHATVGTIGVNYGVDVLTRDLRNRIEGGRLRDPQSGSALCRVYDFDRGLFVPQQFTSDAERDKWNKSDYHAARALLGLAESVRIFDTPQAQTAKIITVPTLDAIVEVLNEAKLPDLRSSSPKPGIPTADMFTQSARRRQTEVMSPLVMNLQYFETDDTWINYYQSKPAIQKGLLGSLVEEIAKHARGRERHERNVVAQLYRIADLLFDQQTTVDEHGRSKTIVDIDVIALYERLKVVVENHAHERIIPIQSVATLAYDLIDNPLYGVHRGVQRLIPERLLTPAEMLERFNPNYGPYAQFGTLGAREQRRYCADAFNELVGHIAGRDAAVPGLSNQIELIRDFILQNTPANNPVDGQRRSVAPIDAPGIRVQLLQLLQHHRGNDSFEIRYVETFVRGLLDEQYGLNAVQKVIRDPEEERRALNPELLSQRVERKKQGNLRSIPPGKILEKHKNDLEALTDGKLNEKQKFRLAYVLMNEVAAHATVGSAGWENLSEQFMMWAAQLRDVSDYSELKWWQKGLQFMSYRSRGLHELRPVRVIESLVELLQQHKDAKELVPSVLAQFVEERIEDQDDGLGAYEKYRLLKRLARSTTEATKEGYYKVETGWDVGKNLTVKLSKGCVWLVKLPVRVWDGTVGRLKQQVPGVYGIGKSTIIFSEIMLGLKGLTELTKLSFLRSTDNFYNALIQAMAITAEEMRPEPGEGGLLPDVISPVHPWLRENLLVNLPNEMMRIGWWSDENVYTRFAELVRRIDIVTPLQFIASTPGMGYVLGAFVMAGLYRYGPAWVQNTLNMVPGVNINFVKNQEALRHTHPIRLTTRTADVMTLGGTVVFRKLMAKWFDGDGGFFDKWDGFVRASAEEAGRNRSSRRL